MYFLDCLLKKYLSLFVVTSFLNGPIGQTNNLENNAVVYLTMFIIKIFTASIFVIHTTFSSHKSR